MMVALVLAGCSSSKYTDRIDQAVHKQEQYQKALVKENKGDVAKSFDRNQADIYVYGRGKYVILAYKPFKDDAEVHYYAYKFKGKKGHYVEGFNAKGYMQNHEANYKEENLNSDRTSGE